MGTCNELKKYKLRCFMLPALYTMHGVLCVSDL
jgi:hypothetical protein